MAVTGTWTPDDLISGKFPIVDDVIMVPAGTPAFKRGAILDDTGVPVVGGVSATEPDSIALEDCDASGADPVRCVIALCGGFNANALSAGADTTVAAQKAALRAKSIYITAALRDGN
jgi:hypothetical protein